MRYSHKEKLRKDIRIKIVQMLHVCGREGVYIRDIGKLTQDILSLIFKERDNEV